MKKARGFTLIETLVALLVVAVAYTGVSGAVSRFVDQRLILSERNASHRIAWNRLMEQYQVARGAPIREHGAAAREGESEWLGQRWRWQLSSEQAAADGLARHEVTVYQAAHGTAGKPAGSLAAYFFQR